MYEEHFGLKSKPFGSTAAGSAVFVGPQQAKLMKSLNKGLDPIDSIVVVTGPVGSGKTTVVNRALESLSPARLVARIGRMGLASNEVLELLLTGFGVKCKGLTTIHRFAAFRRRLAERAASGLRLAIVVEEAQRLGADALAELEALTAADFGDAIGANIILMGRTDLKDWLAAPTLARVHQRARMWQSVEPLIAPEVQGYLRNSIRSVGGDYDRIFDEGAADMLFRCTGGIPRVINNLCESAMTAAAENAVVSLSADFIRRHASETLGIDANIVSEADDESGLTAPADVAAAAETAETETQAVVAADAEAATPEYIDADTVVVEAAAAESADTAEVKAQPADTDSVATEPTDAAAAEENDAKPADAEDAAEVKAEPVAAEAEVAEPAATEAADTETAESADTEAAAAESTDTESVTAEAVEAEAADAEVAATPDADAMKARPADTESAAAESTDTESVAAEAVEAEAADAEVAATPDAEAAKAQPANAEAAAAESTDTESVVVEAVEAEAADAEATATPDAEAAKAEPAKTEAAAAESTDTESGAAEATDAETAQTADAEVVKAEPVDAEAVFADAVWAGSTYDDEAIVAEPLAAEVAAVRAAETANTKVATPESIDAGVVNADSAAAESTRAEAVVAEAVATEAAEPGTATPAAVNAEAVKVEPAAGGAEPDNIEDTTPCKRPDWLLQQSYDADGADLNAERPANTDGNDIDDDSENIPAELTAEVEATARVRTVNPDAAVPPEPTLTTTLTNTDVIEKLVKLDEAAARNEVQNKAVPAAAKTTKSTVVLDKSTYEAPKAAAKPPPVAPVAAVATPEPALQKAPDPAPQTAPESTPQMAPEPIPTSSESPQVPEQESELNPFADLDLTPEVAAASLDLTGSDRDKSPLEAAAALAARGDVAVLESIPELTLDDSLDMARIDALVTEEAVENPANVIDPKVAAELGRAKSLDDLDDRMAATLFGDEDFDAIAAAAVALAPAAEELAAAPANHTEAATRAPSTAEDEAVITVVIPAAATVAPSPTDKAAVAPVAEKKAAVANAPQAVAQPPGPGPNGTDVPASSAQDQNMGHTGDFPLSMSSRFRMLDELTKDEKKPVYSAIVKDNAANEAPAASPSPLQPDKPPQKKASSKGEAKVEAKSNGEAKARANGKGKPGKKPQAKKTGGLLGFFKR